MRAASEAAGSNASPRMSKTSKMTADACQRPVVTGPVEATAMGNLMMQVRASGEVGSLTEMRAAIRKAL